MKRYITIDGGTTNTRLHLIEGAKITDMAKLSVGASGCAENKTGFINELKNCIFCLLKSNNVHIEDLEAIIASGMITSELGLFNLPHISIPAGVKELCSGMKKVRFKELGDIEIAFIPGVKCSGENLEENDMMRGEETEIFGLECVSSNTTYILPGSHSKIIHTDSLGRISKFATALTGEMVFALSQNTVLKNTVSLENSKIDNKFLKKGYSYANEHGINEALFKVRILDKLLMRNSDEIYSFFLGAVLCGEISLIVKKASDKIVVGGKKQLKNAISILLKDMVDKEVICCSDDEVLFSTALGAIKIYEAGKNI